MNDFDLIETIMVLVQRFGLGVLTLVFIFWVFRRVLDFLFGIIHKAFEHLIKTMERLNDRMDKMSDKFELHEQKANERANYQREEHRKMIELLDKIYEKTIR